MIIFFEYFNTKRVSESPELDQSCTAGIEVKTSYDSSAY